MVDSSLEDSGDEEDEKVDEDDEEDGVLPGESDEDGNEPKYDLDEEDEDEDVEDNDGEEQMEGDDVEDNEEEDLFEEPYMAYTVKDMLAALEEDHFQCVCHCSHCKSYADIKQGSNDTTIYPPCTTFLAICIFRLHSSLNSATLSWTPNGVLVSLWCTLACVDSATRARYPQSFDPLLFHCCKIPVSK